MREMHDYRRIFDALDGALFPAALWSPRLFRFVWANSAFKELLHGAIEDVDRVGMPKEGFLSDEASAAHMQDAAYIGLPFTDTEYECVTPYGAHSYWQVTYLPLRADFADPFDVLVTAADVTPDVSARNAARAKHEDALRSIGLVESTLLSSLDACEILDRVLLEATESLDADWGWVVEREAEGWVICSAHGLPDGSVGRSFGDGGRTLPDLVTEKRTVVAEESLQDADPLHVGVMRRHDVGGFMLVPVMSRGLVTRVMGFCWGQPLTISSAHMEFAERLQVSLALAMQNAATYALERGLRRTLQSAFLPLPSSTSGIEVGHLCYSATPETTVGGDFYEIMRLTDDRLGVLIGDAPGRGVEATALATLMRETVRAEALRSSRPERVVRRADRIVYGSKQDRDPFTSLLYGSLEPATGRFRYCATGHVAPVLKRTREYATALPHVVTRDRASLELTASETALRSGDLLLLYTDGLTEAANAEGTPFGTGRLLEALDRHAGDPTAGIPEALFGEVFSHSHGMLVDDAAILAIRAA